MTEREFAQDAAALRGLRDEVDLPPDLKRAVMARVRSARRAAMIQRCAAVGSLAAAMLVAFWTRPVWKVESMPAPPLALARPPVLAVAEAPRQPKAAQRHRPPASHTVAKAPPITVKLLTDDPDIVIYWIIEPKGDGG